MSMSFSTVIDLQATGRLLLISRLSCYILEHLMISGNTGTTLMAATDDELPNRQWELISVSIAMLVLSTCSTVWRIVVRHRTSSLVDWSDWLMLGGTVSEWVPLPTRR
jgi:hypothetical protein